MKRRERANGIWRIHHLQEKIVTEIPNQEAVVITPLQIILKREGARLENASLLPQKVLPPLLREKVVVHLILTITITTSLAPSLTIVLNPLHHLQSLAARVLRASHPLSPLRLLPQILLHKDQEPLSHRGGLVNTLPLNLQASNPHQGMKKEKNLCSLWLFLIVAFFYYYYF